EAVSIARFEVGVDVVRPAVDVAEQARRTKDSGAVRDSHADIGSPPSVRTEDVAQVHVDAGIQVVQQPGRRPFATALAVHLMPGNPVRPGKSEAEAEARLHEVAPGKAVVERLHVRIDNRKSTRLNS